ncbi:MAG TPA: galactokinase family protein [Gaiellaceae bacterium]
MRRFFAPGRVNLIGEYTDLVGGLVLPAALELGITLACEPSDAVDLRTDQATTDWTNYVDAVVRELAACGRPDVGARGSLTTTLPVGAGLSSSAALEVVVALGLCAVADFSLEPLALAHALRRAEHAAVGVPSGIMDQAASLLGRSGHALLLDTRELTYDYVPIPKDLSLVIVHSGLRRSLAATGYAERKRELEAGDPRRLRHVHSEGERVLAVADALRADDREALGQLFRAGHKSLRIDLEVTTPELDRLVALAYEHGAVGARMTGGGFGGAIVALVDRTDADTFAERVVAAYGPEARAFVSEASDGARELQSDR